MGWMLKCTLRLATLAKKVGNPLVGCSLCMVLSMTPPHSLCNWLCFSATVSDRTEPLPLEEPTIPHALIGGYWDGLLSKVCHKIGSGCDLFPGESDQVWKEISHRVNAQALDKLP